MTLALGSPKGWTHNSLEGKMKLEKFMEPFSTQFNFAKFKKKRKLWKLEEFP